MNSCPKLADTTSETPTPNMEENMKIETPLPESPQQKPSSSNLASTAKDTHPRAALTLDEAIEYELKHGRRLDPNMDQRKLRRTVSNRLSAQRSRIKKVKYIDQMEKTVIELEKLILFLTPQVENQIENKKELMEENESLQKLAAIRLNESKLAELEVEQKQAEIARLKELEKTAKRNICDERLKQITTAHPYAKLGYNYENDDEQQQLAAGFTSCKMPIQALTGQGDDDDQDEEETDQYINFEALNNVEPAASLHV
ncbi:hypothetical protein ABFX02_04G085400 [Erythranthe guttata]